MLEWQSQMIKSHVLLMCIYIVDLRSQVQSHVGGRFSSTGSLTSATPGSLYCCSRERHKDLIARGDWTRGPQYEIVSAFRFCLLEMHFIWARRIALIPSRSTLIFPPSQRKESAAFPRAFWQLLIRRGAKQSNHNRGNAVQFLFVKN